MGERQKLWHTHDKVNGCKNDKILGIGWTIKITHQIMKMKEEEKTMDINLQFCRCLRKILDFPARNLQGAEESTKNGYR